MRRLLQSNGRHAAAACAVAAGLFLAACGGAKDGAAAEASADDTASDMSDTELRETDLDMPDVAISDAVPQDPAGRLAADDRSGAGALAVDPLASDYHEAPPPAATAAPAGN